MVALRQRELTHEACLGYLKKSRSHYVCQNLKLIETLRGSVTNSVQMVSTTHFFLKVASLNSAPTVETVGRAYVSRMGEGARSL